MTRISDFSNADEEYLASRHADYRQTPAAEKEAFREQCAKHIIASRELSLDDAPSAYDKFDKRIDGYTKVLLHP